MKTKLIVLSLAIIAAGFQSCNKDSSNSTSSTDATTTDASLTTNLTAALATVITTQVNQISTADIQSASVSYTQNASIKGFGDYGHRQIDFSRISKCATVTVSGTTYPKTITIDYGTGCSDGRGPTKKGKIIITISDTIANAGSVKTVTYQDFYIDSMKVDLTSTLKNLGKNTAGNWVIAYNYTQKTVRNSATIVDTDADTTEWVSGFTTSAKSDDVFYKTGSGSITINDTIAYSRTITKALLTDISCGYIKSGTIVLTNKTNTVTIDYGDGTCDNVATVTTNGTTETINLDSYRFHENGRFDNHCRGHKEGWYSF
jgi:hypothetical protein